MASILITGAAGGIGHALALRALTRGDIVFAADLRPVAREKFPDSPNLHTLSMDVRDNAAVLHAFEQADAVLAGRPLDAVVNCAGVSPPAALELMSVDEIARVMDINAMGSLRVLKASIPRLRGHGGRVVLVTSLWGQASGPMLGAYCASKHAVEAFADAARRETAGMNLHVIVAEPGVVQTEMYASNVPATEALLAKMSADDDRLYGALYRRYVKLVASGGGSAITPERAAQEIEAALHARRPRARYRFGMDSKIVCVLNWLLPDRWMDGLMALSLNNKPLS